MTELLDLYQEVILDHNRAPHNYRRLANANKTALGHNPLCGDQLTLYLNLEGGVISDVSFLGSGCAISKASASIMTDEMKGKTVEEAEALFDRFHAMLTGAPDARPDTAGLGKLAVFSGVREFPVRVKCATLAWHTLKSALQGETSASTE
jgi:nitrogen fixation NifU-like protein